MANPPSTAFVQLFSAPNPRHCSRHLPQPPLGATKQIGSAAVVGGAAPRQHVSLQQQAMTAVAARCDHRCLLARAYSVQEAHPAHDSNMSTSTASTWPVGHDISRDHGAHSDTRKRRLHCQTPDGARSIEHSGHRWSAPDWRAHPGLHLCCFMQREAWLAVDYLRHPAPVLKQHSQP
ncbi:hypothetical protein P171DRAFT_1123 [Karstenula rhodostoma CBS 690.94]|uniref:Uncharacterized protein n=1 Tax=Karstenula rhodostoma CBS 690.94 TaxID=1392251 RepID=A0A9P4PYJ8_9PLEO|nr:hypothetical protein P171DRAFT_1123 [Karstenula rhodostoma CBS 690.94]